MMPKTKQPIVLAAIVLMVALGMSALSTEADDSPEIADVTASPAYRTLFRHEVEERGGHEKGALLRLNSTKTLQAGLNQLSADGWELVAVDGGRSLPLSGPNEMKANYPPVYIFKRAER